MRNRCGSGPMCRLEGPPSPPLCAASPMPAQAAPSRSIAKRAREEGGERAKGRVGKEGLWLEGRVLQLPWLGGVQLGPDPHLGSLDRGRDSQPRPRLRGVQMAAAKWQQANGAKKCENGRPKTVRNRQLKKCENERKSAKTVENKRKQAQKYEDNRDGSFGDRSLAIFQWPYSGGHLGFPYRPRLNSQPQGASKSTIFCSTREHTPITPSPPAHLSPPPPPPPPLAVWFVSALKWPGFSGGSTLSFLS